MNSIITGTGSYIPKIIKKNSDFLDEHFYGEQNEPFVSSNKEIIEKFVAITGIEERRYLEPDLQNSDAAAIASKIAIEESNIDNVVIALPQSAYADINRIVSELHTLAVKVWIIPDYFRF